MKTPINNIVTIAAIFILLSNQARAELRTWTDHYGHTIEAELVENYHGTVTLKKAQGKEVQISISKLCANDQKYVLKNTPPKISIDVIKMTDRHNEGFTIENPNDSSEDRDLQIQTTAQNFKVTLEKDLIPYDRPMQAELYIIGYIKQSEEFILMSKTVTAIDFNKEEPNNKFIFSSEETTTKDLQGGAREMGTVFHGYLVALVDEKGQVFGVKASRSRMQEHVASVRKMEAGSKIKKSDVALLINKSQ